MVCVCAFFFIFTFYIIYSAVYDILVSDIVVFMCVCFTFYIYHTAVDWYVDGSVVM